MRSLIAEQELNNLTAGHHLRMRYKKLKTRKVMIDGHSVFIILIITADLALIHEKLVSVIKF